MDRLKSIYKNYFCQRICPIWTPLIPTTITNLSYFSHLLIDGNQREKIKQTKACARVLRNAIVWLVLFELDFFLIQHGREESQLIANAEEISRTEKIIAILKRFQLEICTTPYSTHFQGQEKEAGCCFI